MILFMILSFLQSCGSYDLGSRTFPTTSVDVQNPQWGDVQTIIKNKCDNCHGDNKTEFAPKAARYYGFSNDINTVKNNAYIMWYRISQVPSNPMPTLYSTPLSDQEKQGLEKFLTQYFTP